jgi:hypothetical protein
MDSWPFTFLTQATKAIRKEMDFFINATSKTPIPIRLPNAWYNELLNTLPDHFLRIGKPLYRGRIILRMREPYNPETKGLNNSTINSLKEIDHAEL